MKKSRKKYFRPIRGLFVDSIAEMKEVNGLYDIMQLVTKGYPKKFFQNIHIDPKPTIENRCIPYGWGNITYSIHADHSGYKNQIVGMCNFYEK